MTSSPTRHTFLSLFLSSLLLGCVPARSLRDENTLRELMVANTDTLEPQYVTFLHRLMTFMDDDLTRNLAESAKRSWADQDEEEEMPFPASVIKRAMWTPLGHLPASARIGRPQSGNRKHADAPGSPNSVFRYG